MKRRILALLLSAAAAFGCMTALSACSHGNDGTDGIDDTDGIGGEEETSLDYTPIEQDGVTVAYSVAGLGADEEEDADESVDVVIPAAYNNLPVISIDDNAFDGADNIKSVEIPDSVTSIGESAFYQCTGLESVSLGSGVESIGSFAFAKCDNLTSVNVGGIGEWCAIEFGNISSNPMYFATRLYVNGELAGDIVIPDNSVCVPDYAFYECENITGVVIGLGVKSVGVNSFYGCENLATLNTGDGVETIGELAFAECHYLVTVEIGSAVEDIGDYSFYNCGKLEEIVLPPSVRTIGELAFAACGLTTVSLNDGLESIGAAAFTGCPRLQSFNMPDSVTSIGMGVLMFGIGGAGFGESVDASNTMTRIKMSNSLTEISDYAFSNTGITGIVIGEKVETIKYSSFYGCTALESIVMPKTVKKIESYAFYRCAALSTVYYEGTAEDWKEVKIGENGNDISNATVYFYSEEQPEDEGSFWHYNENGQIEIW